MAWMIPGMYPKTVKRILRSNAPPQPVSRNTPNGGKMTANMNLKMSEQVRAMLKQ